MPRKKTPSRTNPDPQLYVEVRTREGSYYRLKRGLGKPALLNGSCRQQQNLTAVSSPAASAIRRALLPYLDGLDTGRFIARVGAAIKKALNEGCSSVYSYLLDYEIQPYYPLSRLLFSVPKLEMGAGQLHVSIAIDRALVKRLSPLVSHFYFELVLLQGVPGAAWGERVPEVESTISPLYAFEGLEPCVCHLQLHEKPPAQKGEPWMLLLKFCSLEGNELAHHPRHYGMKVIAVGG